MAFNQDGLRAFIGQTEGAPPPVFAGRQDIIKDIEDAAGLAWNGRGAVAHGAAKATRIIQGAPGAGKSSILAELRKRSLRAGDIRVVGLSSEVLTAAVPTTILTIAAAGGLPPERWRNVQARISGGISIGIANLATEAGWTGTPHEAPQHLTSLKEIFPPEKWRAPVIVAIDEAQRFRSEIETPHARLLQGIHGNSNNLPLTLVLAGLGDTADRASAMELTRGRKIHEIGALASDEIPSLINNFCRKFGMDPEAQREMLASLVNPCGGWPGHLHFTLQALGREALGTDGDLARIDWPKVGREAAESRIRYYRAQQSQKMEESTGLVAAVLSDLQPGHGRVDVINSIDRHVGRGTGVEWQLPEGMTARRLTDHLIHQGALHSHEDKTITCPIPSFRTFLIEAGGLTPTERPPVTP